MLNPAPTKMIPRSFYYFAPRKLSDAVSLISRYSDGAKILAGGQSLIPVMKLRLASPEYIIDINRISELSYIKKRPSSLAIGSMTRHFEIAASKIVATHFPALSDAVRVIGDTQVRNLGTIGGSVAHADPAGDYAPVLLALGASVKAVGRKTRMIPIEKFFVGIFTTALRPNEILTEIQIPFWERGSAGTYLKLERKAGDFAIAGVAAQVTLSKNGECSRVGIGLGAVGSTPLKAGEAEKYLLKRKLNDESILKACELASSQSQPSSDLRGSSEYKTDIVKVLLRRALIKIRGKSPE